MNLIHIIKIQNIFICQALKELIHTVKIQNISFFVIWIAQIRHERFEIVKIVKSLNRNFRNRIESLMILKSNRIVKFLNF